MAPIVDKMCENRLRWLEHILRREKTEAVFNNMSVDGKRGRGRPKKRWFEVIECDMRMTGVCEKKLKIVVNEIEE
ncbi:Uncharacterized protein FWK35_00001635 [Aphis craccivora]|uniref:Uncharacterized protein n=1 Tax=Aphis craccivora TaxID=307492 RepID=A0A6G0ZN63_APHCR|nr:Uncharacterized protein FWK35_00001635 [Aphis craccivora]